MWADLGSGLQPVHGVHITSSPLHYLKTKSASYAKTSELSTKLKGKSAPLQAWSGPEGYRKLRFPDYVTMAQDDGKVVSLTHWPLLPQKILLVFISVRG